MRRWGTRWRSHGTIVRRTCCGRRWRRSSTSAIRWCGWRARSIGGFSTGGLPAVCTAGAGQPPLPTRLVAGLFILKHMHDLSDEVLCARWLENPYYQFFCGELSFCHQLPFDRSSLTHWRQRLGEEQLVALLQESLSVAHKTGALATRDLERVVVDTTVQPKAIAHPTDARLLPPRAREAGRSGASATMCRCGRAIAGWPSGRRSWLGAIPTRTSSSAPGANSNSCAPGWAG